MAIFSWVPFIETQRSAAMKNEENETDDKKNVEPLDLYLLSWKAKTASRRLVWEINLLSDNENSVAHCKAITVVIVIDSPIVTEPFHRLLYDQPHGPLLYRQ